MMWPARQAAIRLHFSLRSIFSLASYVLLLADVTIEAKAMVKSDAVAILASWTQLNLPRPVPRCTRSALDGFTYSSLVDKHFNKICGKLV